MKNHLQRIAGWALCLLLLGSFCPSLAEETGSVSEIQAGDLVYFGTADEVIGFDGAWRVLDAEQTNTGEAGMFLLSENLIGRDTRNGLYFRNEKEPTTRRSCRRTSPTRRSRFRPRCSTTSESIRRSCGSTRRKTFWTEIACFCCRQRKRRIPLTGSTATNRGLHGLAKLPRTGGCAPHTIRAFRSTSALSFTAVG